MGIFNKYFLIGIVCLSLSVNLCAQEKESYVSHPDTLRIDLTNGQAISFAFKNIQHADFGSSFITNWLESINKIQSIVILEPYENPIEVRLVNKLIENEMKDLVEIKSVVKSTNTYISRNGQVYNLASFNQMLFEIQDVKIKATLTTLENWNILKELNFENLQQKLMDQKENTSDKRRAYYLNTNLKNNSFTNFKVEDSGVHDFININAGIGVGLFRDKLAPDISLNASISIRDKHGVNIHKFGLQSSFHYFFDRAAEENYDMNVNTFLTAFYKRNLSKSTLKSSWAGIGVGYLVKESGGYFGENTFSLGLFLNAHQSSIDIIPELIITDDFKTIFPSIRLGLTF